MTSSTFMTATAAKSGKILKIKNKPSLSLLSLIHIDIDTIIPIL